MTIQGTGNGGSTTSGGWFSWLWSTKTRKRLTVLSIIITIAGIYLNVSINYSQLLSSRARSAADAIQAINLAFGSVVAANGKQCIEFALAELEANDRAEIEKSVLKMWDDKDDRPFVTPDQSQRDLLVQCLTNLALPTSAAIPGVLPAPTPVQFANSTAVAVRKHVRKQIFGYLNIYETVFDLVRTEKIDSRMVCDQLGSELMAHSVAKYVQKLRENLIVKNDAGQKKQGDEAVRESYPGFV
ncbi:hypothetical protein G6321_00003265 (plasmid) [Bradyrhizobium barranii subsp. barranii]|uniref:Uncharacterized protein n=1 Tax=Bradyrhizobium barranii subsp. barranii TaxID=2823807 RepID=A0A7Z0QPA5_9BRAD|nr:hypothetical protein [Bradyrhizobium barranii]UGX89818.1 hypothetical protein G6321_00003265 [Bradyrhizobium barranii subsp. barranii]